MQLLQIIAGNTFNSSQIENKLIKIGLIIHSYYIHILTWRSTSTSNEVNDGIRLNKEPETHRTLHRGLLIHAALWRLYLS